MDELTPADFDPAWLGCRELADLARRGTRRHEHAWISQFWAWLHPRMDPELTRSLSSPGETVAPRGFSDREFPVVGAIEGEARGRLGMLRCDSGNSGSPSHEVSTGARGAVEFLRAQFERLGAAHPPIEFHIAMSGEADGESAGLAAFCAALLRFLDIPNEHRAVATGRFTRLAGGEVGFEPVSERTLAGKFECARRFGYRHFIVTADQAGLPDRSGIEVVRVANDPVLAIPELLRILAPAAGEEKIAEALAAYESRAVRPGADDATIEGILTTTQYWIDDGQPKMVRCMAHEIRATVLRHAGRTNEAENEATLATSIEIGLLPDRGWLHDYLRWHRLAHRAIQALDSGRWADDESEHREVDQALEWMQMRTRAEVFAALALHNARARRLDFQGRLAADRGLLRRAVGEYLRLRSFWDIVWRHAEDRGFETATETRQHNQVLEPLLALRALEGELPIDLLEGVELWPSRISDFGTIVSAFDLVAALRWRAAVGQPVSERDVNHALDVSAPDPAGGSRFPNHLVWETILVEGLGSARQGEVAARRLACCAYLFRTVDRRSILGLLAPRASAVLRRAGRAAPDLVRPNPDSPAAAIFDRLIALPDDQCIWRSPY